MANRFEHLHTGPNFTSRDFRRRTDAEPLLCHRIAVLSASITNRFAGHAKMISKLTRDPIGVATRFANSKPEMFSDTRWRERQLFTHLEVAGPGSQDTG